MAQRIDPVTAALAKEAREVITLLREMTDDLKWRVRESRSLVLEARDYLPRRKLAVVKPGKNSN
jgi:predicted secreted protein